jgi:heat shock protein HtpX
MNAAAFGGEEEPAILVTQGLAGALTERELAGVLAHEIAHIRNRDLRLFAFAEVTKMLAYFVSRIGWFMLLIQFPLLLLGQALLPLPAVLLLAAGPSMVLLLQLALLRTREFAADLTAVELSGDPIALASALRRIERPRLRIFDYVLPLPEPAREPANPLRTHPSTEERVRRLSALAAA